MSHIRKALVVDDEDHIRKYIGLILKSIGATTIVEAVDGAEGVAVYQREQPDFVLLDVNMPVMDGIEALRQIRSINPQASVVMLTSLATRQTIEQAISGGALHYIRKDTPRDEFIALLNEVIDGISDKNQASAEP